MSAEYYDELFSESFSICSNDYKAHIQELKHLDKGYNIIYRVVNKKKISIELYTSGDIGSNIRNAETGQYYEYKVGSANQDLFFSVKLATGECVGTLFYLSPKHCMDHLHSFVNEETISLWEEKRSSQIRIINSLNKKKSKPSIIR